MRILLISLVLLPSFALAGAKEISPTAEKSAGVAWYDGTIDAALAEAKASGRPLMVDVFATWCGPCHELDKQVFSRADVATEAERWLPVKVDAENAPGGPEFAEKYHVVGFPTVLFIDSEGKEIDRIFGYVGPEAFLSTMKDYAEGRGTLADLAAKSKARPLDLELALDVGFRYAVRGDAVQAKRYFSRLFAARRMLQQSGRSVARGAADAARLGAPGDFNAIRQGAVEDMSGGLERIDALLASAYLVIGKYLYLRGEKNYPAALKILKELRQRYPDSPEAKEVPYQIAVAYSKNGQEKLAQKELERYLETSGGGPGPVNTIAWFAHRNGVLQTWATGLAEDALAKNPQAAGLWDTLAELKNDQGDVEGAVACIDAAVKAEPEEAYYQGQKTRFDGLLAEKQAAEAKAAEEAAAAEAAKASEGSESAVAPGEESETPKGG